MLLKHELLLFIPSINAPREIAVIYCVCVCMCARVCREDRTSAVVKKKKNVHANRLTLWTVLLFFF